jgi:hypothetical protein
MGVLFAAVVQLASVLVIGVVVVTWAITFAELLRGGVFVVVVVVQVEDGIASRVRE